MHDAHVAAANVDGGLRGRRRRADAAAARAVRRRGAAAGGVEFAWLALGSQARREALPSSDVDSAIVWFGAPGDPDVHARLQRGRTDRGLGARSVRAARRRARRVGVRTAVRPLARVLAACGAQLDRRPDAGEGAGAGVGAGRQPAGVGRAHRHAGRRHLPARAEQPGAAAAAGAVRALAPPADGVPARARRRAHRRAPRPARPQAGRRDPDRRPRPLGRDRRRRDERVDDSSGCARPRPPARCPTRTRERSRTL